ERYLANSPHHYLQAITTPMLVIHGDKDYRVPVGEALRLWSGLTTRPGGPPDVKFLYFPTENHWILTPGHAVVWYQAVLAVLPAHVLGEPWQRPDLLYPPPPGPARGAEPTYHGSSSPEPGRNGHDHDADPW